MAEVLHVGLLPSDPDGGHKSNQDDQDHESHHGHEPDLLSRLEKQNQCLLASSKSGLALFKE